MPKKNPKAKSTIKAVPVQFDPAEEVEKLAKRLIPKHHTHLVNAKIAYLFKNKEMKSKGKIVVATAKKVSKEMTTLSGYNFLITVAYPTWRDLSDDQKLAIVDHELEHCLVDEDAKTGETKYLIIPHDVEEFSSIIRRHGLYTTDLVRIGMVIEDVLPANIKKDVVVTKVGKPEKIQVVDETDDEDDPDEEFDDDYEPTDDEIDYEPEEQDFV